MEHVTFKGRLIREDRIVDSSSRPRTTTTSPPRTYPGDRQDTLRRHSAEQLTTLAGIEQAVRNQMQKHVMPGGGSFCHSSHSAGHRRTLKSILGELPLTNQQALRGAPHTTESVSRVVLFASECQCILPAC